MKIKDLAKIERPREKLISKHLVKSCACCGKQVKVFVYKNNTYRGGHYFGKIPLHSEEAIGEAVKAGFNPWYFKNSAFRVFKKDPKPYAHAEYWECPKCYW